MKEPFSGQASYRVTVLGMGYVGLTTAVVLAWLGHEVHGVEVDPDRLSALRVGRPPFLEPGLATTMTAVSDRLSFSDSILDGPAEPEVIFIAVGTPSLPDGSVDLAQVWSAADTIGRSIGDSRVLVVNKTTCPPGTLEMISARLPKDTLVASNPEFLRQGRALFDALFPERLVVGAVAADAVALLRDLYAPMIAGTTTVPPGIMKSSVPATGAAFLVMHPRSAELAKYAANAFLATKISFVNEMAALCDRLGADVRDIASVMGTDARIGPQFLQAGVGYGGGCLPKDTSALAHLAEDVGYRFRLLQATMDVNASQWECAVEKLSALLGGLQGQRVAVLGLAFKADTDDLRGAISFQVVRHLIAQDAEVVVHDPLIGARTGTILPPRVRATNRLLEAVSGADAILLLTDWPEYRELDPARLVGMRGDVVVDGRNALDPTRFRGMRYAGIGVHALTAQERAHDQDGYRARTVNTAVGVESAGPIRSAR